MKFLRLLPLALSLALAGCESSGDFGSSVSHLVNRGEPKTRVFKADQKTTYEAAKAALGTIDYHFTHGGPAQGKLEAMSDVMGGDTPGSSRQVSLKVTLNPTLDGQTEVGILFSEVVEADSSNQPGMATETPMADTPLYEVYFRALQQKLPAPATP
jgi:hypothetical protein